MADDVIPRRPSQGSDNATHLQSIVQEEGGGLAEELVCGLGV